MSPLFQINQGKEISDPFRTREQKKKKKMHAVDFPQAFSFFPKGITNCGYVFHIHSR